MKEFVDLFTVPLGRKFLSIDNQKILEYCTSLKQKDPGRTISNLGGWQSNDISDYSPELNKLFGEIHVFANEMCRHMELDPVTIYNSWVNINEYKDSNWPHTHADAVLSGVYYVKTPENCGDIEFENVALDSIPFFLQYENRNKFNSTNWKMQSKEGILYIFPSWLRHGVNPNFNKNEERVSISFNLIH